MIVTITLNPVLRVEYTAGSVAKGQANHVRRVRYRAGGRGLAVARVLQTFGHDVVAGGLAGGSAGELIRNDLARAGVATQFTRIAAESRRIVAVADESDGEVTSFAEPAPYITTEELGRLAADYRELLTGATAVVLCGSLPEGLPAEIYGSFASYAAEAGVPVVLNAGGNALAYGAKRGPALIVPEAESAGRAPIRLEPGRGAIAVLSRDRVLVRTDAEEWRAGLGAADSSEAAVDDLLMDALVAGFVPGIALGWSWPEILQHAVALGAAWGPDGELDVHEYERALASVDVERSRFGS